MHCDVKLLQDSVKSSVDWQWSRCTAVHTFCAGEDDHLGSIPIKELHRFSGGTRQKVYVVSLLYWTVLKITSTGQRVHSSKLV
jgi:hypothetical protein